MSTRMKTNRNFSDAIAERFYSFRINRMVSPSDAVHLDRPCNSLSEFQVVHRNSVTLLHLDPSVYPELDLTNAIPLG